MIKKILQMAVALFMTLGICACGPTTAKHKAEGLLLTNNPDMTWQALTDSANGGNSMGDVKTVTGRTGQAGAVRLDYALKTKYQYRYATAAIMFSSLQDWSKATGLKFWCKGSGHKLRVVLVQTSVTDYDFHGFVIEATPTDWQEITIPFSAFKQEGWGKPVAFNPAQILELDLKAASTKDGEIGFFEIDDLQVVGDPALAKP